MVGVSRDEDDIINPFIKNKSQTFDFFWTLPSYICPTVGLHINSEKSNLLTIAIATDEKRFPAVNFIDITPPDLIENFNADELEESMFFVLFCVVSINQPL